MDETTLRGMLQGMPVPAIVAELAGALDKPLSDNDKAGVLDLCDALRGSELFRYMLA